MQILIKPDLKAKPRGIAFIPEIQKIRSDGVLGFILKNVPFVKDQIIKSLQKELPKTLGASLPTDFNKIEQFKVNKAVFIPNKKFQIELFARSDQDTIMDYIIEYSKD